jgi:hypothetical protein
MNDTYRRQEYSIVTDLRERYADLLAEPIDPACKALLRDLDATFQVSLPDRDRAAIAGALSQAAAAPRRQWRLPLPILQGPARWASFAAAVVLALGGFVGYQQVHAPAPVSAESILSNAAAAMQLGANQAAHLTYNLVISPPPGQNDGVNAPIGPMTTVADVWVRADANGNVTASSQTLNTPGMQATVGLVAKAKAARLGGSDGSNTILSRPLDHYIQIGDQVYGYDGGNNAIAIPGSHNIHPGWMIPNDVLDGAGVALDLSALAQHSPAQVQLLSPQTLNGAAVDVIQVNGWTTAPGMRTTFYFDAQSYQLRGFDAVSFDPSYPTPSWQARLGSYAVMPASAVSPNTFTLNAPADARIESPIIEPAAFASAFDSVCHDTLNITQLKQILNARSQSLFAACQSTAPAVTADALVAALIAPYQSALEAAVTAVGVTETQVSAALAAQRLRLGAMISTPGGGAGSN